MCVCGGNDMYKCLFSWVISKKTILHQFYQYYCGRSFKCRITLSEKKPYVSVGYIYIYNMDNWNHLKVRRLDEHFKGTHYSICRAKGTEKDDNWRSVIECGGRSLWFSALVFIDLMTKLSEVKRLQGYSPHYMDIFHLAIMLHKSNWPRTLSSSGGD